MIKSKEGLFMEILIWAYQKQESGFTWSDLETEFSLNNKQSNWFQKIFRHSMSASENLIDHLDYYPENNEHRFIITVKGISAVVAYLSLKEAQDSGKRAEYIALWSLGIATIVGVAQILIAMCSR